jgi:predicted PolB exonuclease-like 3'-5' exonuclease
MDIETILDEGLARQVFGLLPEATHEEVRQQLIPICIALIDVDYETCKVLNATVLDSEDERSLLQQFWKIFKFRKGNPIRSTLIHFNGRGFDLPVLFYRSLKHRIPLNVVSKMLGLPGKTDVEGSQVEDLYARKERAKIRDYCMQDTLGTYYIWLTLRLIRGEITEELYRDAFDSAAGTVAECRKKTENFGDS